MLGLDTELDMAKGMASLTLVVESARIASHARVLPTRLYTQSAITEVPPPTPLPEIRFPGEKGREI